MDVPRRRLLTDRASPARAPLRRSCVRARISVRRRHPPPDSGADLRRAARAGDVGDAWSRQDDQLRDHLRAGATRALTAAQDLARGGEGVHRAVLRALPAGAQLPGLDGGLRTRAWLRGDDLQATA